MVRRIAAAAAVAAVAGFLAAGPAVADVDDSRHDVGHVWDNAGVAGQEFVNVGGSNGVTVSNSAAAHHNVGAWKHHHRWIDYAGR
ncbi:hypothetical protein [Streptomyces endophyticus]|uniref:Secreted protein n=1 Tax=Streptomyces endophyticus TaxID=714166 RepID=A0ABU6FD28_9ACTN|nr:hypothetical protein [Streptomyces endophyticus]MEB8340707.1 hypothetical protein [Streptomyces endophyticus]